MKLLDNVAELIQKEDVFGFFDDFEWAITAHRWTTLAADTTATVAVGDAAGGKVVMTTDATDNNECSIFSTAEIFLFAADKPLVCECKIDFTENAANASNIVMGFVSAGKSTANVVTDNGAALAAGSQAVVYKRDGDTAWRCNAGVGAQGSSATSTTHPEVTSAESITAGAAYSARFRIEVNPISSTQAEAVFWIDPTNTGAWRPMVDTNNKPIKLTFLLASATEMNVGLYVKTGAAAGTVVNCDYIAAYQKR